MKPLQRLLPLFLVLQFYLAAPCLAAEALLPEQQRYLDSLLESSQLKKLADARTWHLLLHYRNKTFAGGLVSEIDDPQFFLSPAGKDNPAAELQATLRALLADRESRHGGDSLQCRYPARFRWLDSELGFDPEMMPVQDCESMEGWRKQLNAGSVSLVFSSYYFGNPASIFGHTLLRINSADDSKSSLLDYAISYAADIRDADGFWDYAWNGLTGGFQGRFSIYPYYDIVKLYNDLEIRDLWEYELSLTPEQVEFMLLHAWELSNTYFDYYFMRENCSYHLLSLLEVADPEYNFRERYWLWTFPTETIRQVRGQDGLVEKTVRRPSLRSQFDQYADRLNDDEKALVLRLTDQPGFIESAEFSALPAARRVLLIDAAILYSQFRSRRQTYEAAAQQRVRHELLLNRSRYDIDVSDPGVADSRSLIPPDQGHRPFGISLAAGQFDADPEFGSLRDESFFELSIQPGFHDLLAPEAGHAPNSQIRFLVLSARYGEENDSWRVNRFTLIDVISLNPVSPFFTGPSWKLDIGWERNRDGACTSCTPFILNPGMGLATQTTWHRKEVYFAFLEANLEFDHELEDDRRTGLGATAGLLFDASERWRLAFVAERTAYKGGQSSYVTRLSLRQRYHVSRIANLFIDLEQVEDNHEGKLGMIYHF